jgi:hypothetical protein
MMAEKMGGLPFWEVEFDEHGGAIGAGAANLVAEIPRQRLTDLFLFSHGWNNTRAFARKLYAKFFGEMAQVLRNPSIQRRRPYKIGIVGIVWPAMRWADQGRSTPGQSSAAAVARTASTKKTVPARAQVEALKAVYKTKEQRRAIKELADLIEARPNDETALNRCQDLMRILVADPDAIPAPEDNALETALLDRPARDVFRAFASDPLGQRDSPIDSGGAATMRESLQSAWDGALDALRTATYWQMKRRAGTVGVNGLGLLISEIHKARGDLRLHLIGHSFGARLVSFSLAGLSKGTLKPRSPIKSLALIQGAFSHFAFADRLRYDDRRRGALAGMASRVDGPILVTFSEHDTAVGSAYPLASLASGDDSAKVGEMMDRWQGIGYDGAQEVGAVAAPLSEVGTPYPFESGKFLNLDGNEIIVEGAWPSGAHGDIIHPEIAWVVIAGAAIA